MRRVAILQARMGSSRLPGKVLRDIAGCPMLVQILRRLRRCREIDEIVVATTRRRRDLAVARLAASEGARVYRGSEDDVLSRYQEAAAECRADVIVRVTGDCPLIDPGVTDRVVRELERHRNRADYASNVIRRTYPRGLDAEAFFRDTLERVARLACSSPAREHVTLFLRSERPDLFLVRSVEHPEDYSDLRWTVDTAEDLAVARRLYEELRLTERQLSWREVAAYARAHPDLVRMNSFVPQRTA